jgi:hypothetical protein
MNKQVILWQFSGYAYMLAAQYECCAYMHRKLVDTPRAAAVTFDAYLVGL